MNTRHSASGDQRKPELLGQTVAVIGGSAGIGLEAASRARVEGADVILTARDPGRLERAAGELGALRTSAFDASDPASLEKFFLDLPTPIDHVMVAGPGPHHWPLMEIGFEQARLAISEHILLALRVARNTARRSDRGARCCSWTAPAPAVRLAGSRLCRRPPLRCPHSISRRSGLISSPPASSTRLCRHRSWAIISTLGAISFAPRFPSSAPSGRPAWPGSPSTL